METREKNFTRPRLSKHSKLSHKQKKLLFISSKSIYKGGMKGPFNSLPTHFEILKLRSNTRDMGVGYMISGGMLAGQI